MHELHPTGRHAALLLTISLALAACSWSAAPSAPSAPADASPPPPVDGAVIVVPKPGQLDVHPVAATAFTPDVSGRRLAVGIDWWSGVEPCSVLDSIAVDHGSSVITLTLREGHGPEDVACIEIAQLHRAFADVGELAPGTYTIRDGAGGAPDVQVTVS